MRNNHIKTRTKPARRPKAVAKSCLSASVGKKYRAMLDSSQDLFYTVDLKGRLIYVSRQVENYGYTPEEILGRHVLEFTHPDDRKLAARALENVLKTGKTLPILNYRLLKKDGASFNVEQKSGVILKNGKLAAISCIARDITERKRLETLVDENEETLRKIFDTAEDAIYIKDPDGAYTKANNFCSGLFGLTPEQMKGKTDFDIMPCELAQRLRDEDRELLKAGGTRGSDCEIQTSRGEIRTFNSLKTRLYDSKGRVTGLLGISRDITELKKLQNQVIERRAFETARKITVPAAHDFNNILTAINGYAALILKMLESKNPVRPEIERILSAVKRAAAITEKLQTFGGTCVRKPV